MDSRSCLQDRSANLPNEVVHPVADERTFHMDVGWSVIASSNDKNGWVVDSLGNRERLGVEKLTVRDSKMTLTAALLSAAGTEVEDPKTPGHSSHVYCKG